MKISKIAIKLTLNFAVALIIFSLVIGSVFLYLFNIYTLDVHKNELRNYAEALSEALSGERYRDTGNSYGGYGGYLRFMSEVSDTDVWIVDENLTLLTLNAGQGLMRGRYNFADLPLVASEMIDDVFLGETVFSEDFSEVLSQLTLTVGTPIVDQNGDIWGAVLLHSPVNAISSSQKKGLAIMGISLLLALVVASILSVILSYTFTRPLSKMKATALLLSKGDYSAKSRIEQNDEIGELSETLDLLSDRLYQAGKESDKLEHLRRSFIANISHELRTPVTVIRGSLETLVDKIVTDPDRINYYHNQMLSEAKFLERLVGDLLDLSKLQNTDFIIEMSPVNISDILSDAIRSALQLALKKHIDIRINMPDPNITIMGDYGRLKQMFLNVLDNAIKFSQENSNIDVSFGKSKVIIRDFGVGIEPQVIPYIFDRFYRAQDEKNKSGTGLGLAISKQIADRHNIKLSASNHIDGGAEFQFELPIDNL